MVLPALVNVPWTLRSSMDRHTTFAPMRLAGANVVWRSIDDRRVHGTFTNAGNTIGADLVFDAAGDLVDFVSHDRYQSADGKTYRLVPWSTPVRDYRSYRGVRVAAHAGAIWREPSGDFSYASFELDDIEFNVRAGGDREPRDAFERLSTRN